MKFIIYLLFISLIIFSNVKAEDEDDFSNEEEEEDDDSLTAREDYQSSLHSDKSIYEKKPEILPPRPPPVYSEDKVKATPKPLKVKLSETKKKMEKKFEEELEKMQKLKQEKMEKLANLKTIKTTTPEPVFLYKRPKQVKKVRQVKKGKKSKGCTVIYKVVFD